MIPQFPNMKKLEIVDRRAVEAITSRYPPYSDFNFTSLWAWDTSGERMISKLNGNLVVRFTDYSTQQPFLSFLGENETERTALMLIEFCKASGLPTTLRLVPEISVMALRGSIFNITEDRNNFDYVYSIADVGAMRGGRYDAQRHEVNKFRRENTEARIEALNLRSSGAQQDILALLRLWEKNKIEQNKEYELEHEERAIKRLLETAGAHVLTVTGLFSGRTMLGFSIAEILPNQFGIEHFCKVDTRRAGASDFLIREQAGYFDKMGVAFLNWEQDLGIESLRRSKMSYRPACFLEKYAVAMATAA